MTEFIIQVVVIIVAWFICSTFSGFVFAIFDMMKQEPGKRNQKPAIVINKSVNLSIADPLALKDGLEKMGFHFMCPECSSDKLIMYGVEKISFECRDCGNIHKEGPLKVRFNQEKQKET